MKKFISLFTTLSIVFSILGIFTLNMPKAEAVPPFILDWVEYFTNTEITEPIEIRTEEEYDEFMKNYGEYASFENGDYKSHLNNDIIILMPITIDSRNSEFNVNRTFNGWDDIRYEAERTVFSEDNDLVSWYIVIVVGGDSHKEDFSVTVKKDLTPYSERAEYSAGNIGLTGTGTKKITSVNELDELNGNKKYDNSFFETNFLLAVGWDEPQQRIAHKISAMKLTDNDVSIELEEFMPDGEYPDVITPCYALIELPKLLLNKNYSVFHNEVIQISNLDEFLAFRDEVNAGEKFENKNVYLTSDIDLSSVCGEDVNGEMVSWEPIKSFYGSFDALGHTISGLYIHAETDSREHYGLFGSVYGENSAIKNLTVHGSVYVSRPNLTKPSYADCGLAAAIAGYIRGYIEDCRSDVKIETLGNAICAGGIVGSVGEGVSDCVFDGSIKSAGRYAGGICGSTGGYASVKNCVNNGSVSGDKNVGGIVGDSGNDLINCLNTGDVSGGEYVGGIAGQGNYFTENCTNTGNITGTRYVGGILGEASYATLKNCSNEEAVTGDRCVGGIIGHISNTVTMENCRNAGSISGSAYTGGIVGFTNVETKISRCYNTATVKGTQYTGGVAGSGNSGLVTDCYNTGDVSGNNYVGGVAAIFASDSLKNCYNMGLVSGSEKVGGVGNISGKDSGEADNCYYIDSCCAEGTVFEENCGTQKTSAEFASGEITYLLNGSTSEGELNWYQNIGADIFPVLDNTHSVVLYDGEKYYNDKPTHSHDMSVECGNENIIAFDKALTSQDGNLYINGEAAQTADNYYVLPAGNYYLAENVSLNGDIYILNNVKLCLNGKTLNMGENCIEIHMFGNILSICDCGATGTITGAHCNSSSVSALLMVMGECKLYGGTVHNNTSSDQTDSTSAISVYGGDVKIFGGKVIAEHDNAIYTTPASTSSLTLYGKPVIKGADNYADIYLNNYHNEVIKIGAPLTGGPYRINAYESGVFTSGWDKCMGNADSSNYFMSAKKGCFLNKSGGELQLKKYAIVSQPSKENNYVITTNPEAESYRWYSATAETVTSENAEAFENSICEDDVWTVRTDNNIAKYFKIRLNTGDMLKVKANTNGLHKVIIKDTQSHTIKPNGNNEYEFTAVSDGEFTFYIEGVQWNYIPNVTAVAVRNISDSTVEGQTTNQFTGAQGSYICRAEYADGTVLTSDVISVKSMHIHTWGEWNITTEPTFNTTGKAERICGNDNTHKDNVDLPVLTDTTVWTEGLRIEPTETENGSVTYTSQYGNVQIIIPTFRDETFPYEITGLVLRDSNTLPENSDFAVKYSITQVAERNTNEYDKFFVAAYDTDGKLIHISSKNVRMSVGQILHLGYLIKLNDKKVGSIKAFAWDGFNSMKPLAKTKTLTF
ncbi:MAG: hypothetical protein HFE49_03730 [Clostridia bacterium]|nr:hypothetical protein [Clostridia bacterium]